jgi:hypothetical protein
VAPLQEPSPVPAKQCRATEEKLLVLEDGGMEQHSAVTSPAWKEELQMAYDWNREHRSAEDLEAYPGFTSLKNEQERNFLRHLFANSGNQFFAFSQVYSAPDAETARRGSYALMARKSVREVIEWYLKLSDREKFLSELERACRSRKITPTQFKTFELRAATEFGVSLKTLKAEDQKKSGKAESAPVETKRHKVGDVIDYDGKKVRVTKIDGNGQPVEGDPVEMVNSPAAW